MKRRKIENVDVASVFDGYPTRIRRKLLALRHLILETAASTEGVGEIEESLKWGEPAYLTNKPKSGTTIRIGWKPSTPTRYAMYVHCQTNLIERYRELFGDYFAFEGNRAIVFEADEAVAMDQLAMCITMALTYHSQKRAR